MNTVTAKPMDEWSTLPWKKIERNVFKLQKRIYQASSRDDVKTVRKLQRLLINSQSAKLLAVRKVTQDNQGKKTAGIDGVRSLSPPQRQALAKTLKINSKAMPVRRVWIDKPGNHTEQRPLGIPVIRDRAAQRLIQAALEPEWEARFEPNSYGFRPGRSCHDAIEAIFKSISHKAKYALDADIEKCFDRINHQELLAKVNTSPGMRRQLKAWLKAGVLDNGEWFPTETGTMQGGPISPLLANIALHGLETVIKEQFPPSARRRFYSPIVVRFADDFVVLHDDLSVIEQSRGVADEWLNPMGLRLKPSKTRIAHTLKAVDGKTGFDFLGFHIRQYPVGRTKTGHDRYGTLHGFKTLIKPSSAGIERHLQALREKVRRHRHTDQTTLIRSLNPLIKGWCRYYATAVSKEVFAKVENVLFHELLAWAVRRHPKKNKDWIVHKYWSFTKGKRWAFHPASGGVDLYQHSKTRIRRHVKVQGRRSPYDGDWVYWGSRLGRHPEISSRVALLLKKQSGTCWECGLYFKDGEVLEVDHIIPHRRGGVDASYNLQLLHRHCHDVKTARDDL